MNSKDQNMQTAEFVELLAVSQSQAKNPLFDIIVEDKITIQNYCNALVAKILELKQSQFPAFAINKLETKTTKRTSGSFFDSISGMDINKIEVGQTSNLNHSFVQLSKCFYVIHIFSSVSVQL